MTPPVICYLGIGSNLNDPHTQLTHALQKIAKLPSTRLRRRSPWYHSKAIGPGEQPNYINGVIEIETTLDARQLLNALQEIETVQGRTRELRWGARTLDLDILLYGDLCIHTSDLEIPHPRISERAFVLAPLADLNPQLKLPVATATKSETIGVLLTRLTQDDIWRVDGELGVVDF